jgi:ribokinase
VPASVPGLFVGVGGIGAGMFFRLLGNHTLGREESREGLLLDARDFCKLHIIAHYTAVFLGPGGCRVAPIGCVGDDENGRRLLALLRQAGMDTRHVRTAAHTPTLFSVCFQYPDGAGGNLTTAASAASLVTTAQVRRARPLLAAHRGRGIALAAPEAPLPVRQELVRLAAAHRFRRYVALNSEEIVRPEAAGLLRGADVLSLNRDEAEALLGRRLEPRRQTDFLERLAVRLCRFQPDLRISLTLGAAGACGYAAGVWEVVPAARVRAVSAAGAGDALMAGLIAGEAWGLPFILPGRRRGRLADAPLATALDLGVLLASFSVLSADTIAFDASPAALARHAKRLGLTLAPDLARRLRCP